MIGFLLGFSLCINIILLLGVLYLYKNKGKISFEEVTEEEKRKSKEEQDHYNKILNYNASQAYGGK